MKVEDLRAAVACGRWNRITMARGCIYPMNNQYPFLALDGSVSWYGRLVTWGAGSQNLTVEGRVMVLQ